MSPASAQRFSERSLCAPICPNRLLVHEDRRGLLATQKQPEQGKTSGAHTDRGPLPKAMATSLRSEELLSS
eukprot:609867-Pyramimonas_sp.AAC.1